VKKVYKMQLPLRKMKRKVIWFYTILILLVVVLAAVQIMRFNGIIGFVVKNDLSNLQASDSGSFEGKVLDYWREGNYLIVNYVVRNVSAEDEEIAASYQLIDSGWVLVTEGKQKVILDSKVAIRYSLKFELPKNSFGKFNLILNLQTKQDSLVLSREIFMSEDGVTGLAISESNRDSLSILGIVVVSVFIIFTLYRIAKNLACHPKKRLEKKRHLIKLDLE